MTPRRLPPLTALRAFEAAARHLSFKHAANELSLTPTAISHQIRQLEDHLGVRLFVRNTRRVDLTPAGQSLFPALRDGFDAMARAVQNVRPDAQPRTIVLSTTMAFASRWLLQRLARFAASHPDSPCTCTPATSRSICRAAWRNWPSATGRAAIRA